MKLVVHEHGRRCSKGNRRGFTLVELLTVIGIIGVLVAMLFPAIQMVRESARRVRCCNKVKQLALGLLNFESSNQSFPDGFSTTDKAHPFRTWLQYSLPFVEQSALFEQANVDYEQSSSPFQNHVGMQTVVKTFQCSSDPRSGQPHFTHGNRLVSTTSYLGVNGENWESKDGVMFHNSRIKLSDISDGLSNTLLIGERPPSPDFWFGWWYAGFGQGGTGSGDMVLGAAEFKSPAIEGSPDYLAECPIGPYEFQPGQINDMCSTLHFWSYHPGGGNFANCDGSVHFMAYSSDQSVLTAMATRNKGEVFEFP